jgi:hypothetical protein
MHVGDITCTNMADVAVLAKILITDTLKYLGCCE